MPEELKHLVRRLIQHLVQGDYDSVVAECAQSRLTGKQLAKVIQDYGRKLIMPPDRALDNLDIVPVQDASVPTWSLRVPLWTHEEGRSDLTLELTVGTAPRASCVELDDLHVL
jgi:hypothetical protein